MVGGVWRRGRLMRHRVVGQETVNLERVDDVARLMRGIPVP